MDVIFNCPQCDQELSVDAAGAGTEIACPTCGGRIVIPASPAEPAHVVNPIKTSAAAKEVHHFSVPVHDTPSEVLIAKPLRPLEVAAKETDRTIRIKTIRRTDCVEVGHDRFDEVVSSFLQKVGEPNIVSINTIMYTHLDIGSQKLLTDFGVMIVYKG